MSKNNPLPRAPRSTLCPFVPGEPWDERHGRRKKTAETMRSQIESWAGSKGGTVTVHNDGGHYKIHFPGLVVEWWPESGRVVRDQNWSSPYKAHDVSQVQKKISGWIKKTAPVDEGVDVTLSLADREVTRLLNAYPKEVIQDIILMLGQNKS